MKPHSRMIAIMALLFSLSSVALAGDVDGPSSVVTPPPPVTDVSPGDVSIPTVGGVPGTEGNSFSTSSLIEWLLASII